ncbi:hypothetical protein B0H17DRAFT_1181280 [Mycena rosella]|uniref:Uncharacterized protein n=1 Tax=Mycena rosella TaxID=1033263 RepID=A0AAD7D9V8_MYCRO|nr:hypothetical protein B0H17DRAFT_1181280 [Mycena rosella]
MNRKPVHEHSINLSGSIHDAVIQQGRGSESRPHPAYVPKEKLCFVGGRRHSAKLSGVSVESLRAQAAGWPNKVHMERLSCIHPCELGDMRCVPFESYVLIMQMESAEGMITVAGADYFLIPLTQPQQIAGVIFTQLHLNPTPAAPHRGGQATCSPRRLTAPARTEEALVNLETGRVEDPSEAVGSQSELGKQAPSDQCHERWDSELAGR